MYQGMQCLTMELFRPSEVSTWSLHTLHREFIHVPFLFLARQEKLLQTLMSDIVRSKSQANPLDIPVNFRLYPHSSKSAFLQDTSGAPLPTGPDAFGSSEASLGLTPIHSHMQPQGAWLQQGHSEIPLPQVHSHSQSPPSQSSSGHYMP